PRQTVATQPRSKRPLAYAAAISSADSSMNTRPPPEFANPTGRVACDRLRDRVPVGSPDAVAGAFAPTQPAAGELGCQRLAVREGKHRVGGAVDDDCGRFDPRQRLAWPVVVEQVVVLQGCDVAGALEVTSDEVACLCLVEAALLSREHARVGDEVVEHRAR